MIEFDINNPFNDASKDGMLPDGCGIFERYNTMGAEVDFCGLSPNPADYETPQTLYEKMLALVKKIIIAVDLNTDGSYKPSDFENYPLISDATSVKDVIEILSDFIEKLQKDKFDKLNLKLNYDNGIVSLMFNDIAYTSINIPEEQFLDNKETKFITSATQEDVDKDPSVIIGDPYLRLAFKTIDSEGAPTITYSYIPMNYMSNIYSAEATDSIDLMIKTSGNSGSISANLTVDNDPTNALIINKNGVYVENLSKTITDEVNRATINEARIETLVNTKFNDITDDIELAKQEAIESSALDATEKMNIALENSKIDATEKSTKAKQEAIEAAELDATTKANTAKQEAIVAAELDATTKANTAKQEAIVAAELYATTKANQAKQEAIEASAIDATTKANQAKQEAIEASAIDATEKANQALESAKIDTTTKVNAIKDDIILIASNDATTKANQAKQEAIEASAIDATEKATKAKQEAIEASAIDATTKANIALESAKIDATTKINAIKDEIVTIASLDATEKATKAKQEAIEASAIDATTKANQAKLDAIASAALDATTKANTAKTEAIVAAEIDATEKVNMAKQEAVLAILNEKNRAIGVENQLKIEIDTKVSSVVLSENTEKSMQYVLYVDGINKGEINIPVNQFLKSAIYDAATKQLVFIFRTEDGEVTTPIDMTDLVDTYTAGDGMIEVGNKFSIVVDPLSESYLTVSSNGVKISGIGAAIKTVNDNLTDNLNATNTNLTNEIDRAKVAEKVISDALNTYKIDNKTYVDTEISNVNTNLTNNINNINSNLGDRITAVDIDLKRDLANLNNSLTLKINNVETDLTNKIDLVESDLSTEINKVKTDLNSKIDLVESGLTDNLNITNTNLTNEIDRAKVAEKLNSDALNAYKIDNKTYVDTELATKQQTLVSGINIKTINGDSILGNGDVIISATNTVGDLKMSVLSATHNGWVLCNGAAISRVTYAVLFSAIGTSFGSGDGSTTFNVPNMIGQVAAGANGNLGVKTGTTSHQISVSNLPDYNLTVNNNTQQTYKTDTAGNHTHTNTNDCFKRNAATASEWGSSGRLALPICRNIRDTNRDGQYDNIYLYNDGGSIDKQNDVDWMEYSPSSTITIAAAGDHTHSITPPVHSHIVNSGGGNTSISNYQPTTFLGNYFIYSGVK